MHMVLGVCFVGCVLYHTLVLRSKAPLSLGYVDWEIWLVQDLAQASD
jgi:hypothetical protein